MEAIARQCREGRLNARVVAVLCDRPGAAGLHSARALGIDTHLIPWQGPTQRPAFEHAVDSVLAAATADVIVLAGFMRILSPQFVAARAGRILNIHPSLLPKYTGLHTHRRVLEAGERKHGASVHFVTRELDGGPLVLQSRIEVNPGETEESLSARVQATEHIIYPRVIGWLADGRLVWRQERPWLDGRPLDEPLVEDFSADRN